jgi:hypothetical protein
LARYQQMFSRLPGFGASGAEGLGETRAIAREQLVEFNTELLSYAQGTLNEAFEASKAVINAAAMQDAVEQARKVSELYAQASREVAKPMSRGIHDAAEPTKKAGRKGADDTAKQARLAG